MIAIISDLHLQHTALDVLRYREGGKLRETGVRRNVSTAAFTRFFGMVQDLAERRQAREIHLVFAGDIFELHRTPLWFLEPQIRPTAEPGPDMAANPLRARVDRILEAIDEENAAIWDAIESFVTQPRDPVETIRVYYIPGNHDRLANAWPSVRQKICRWLSLKDHDPQHYFPNRLDFSDGYETIVRHGHEYDAPNFAHSKKSAANLSQSAEAYLAPAFGDYVTVDVAARLALAFRNRYAPELRKPAAEAVSGLSPHDMRQLFLKLTEFDDVRPASLLLDYLVEHLNARDVEIFRVLRPVLRDVVETAVQDPFFKRHAGKHVPKTLLAVLPGLLKQMTPEAIVSVVRLSMGDAADPSESPARLAQVEFEEHPNASVIVAGHTHWPEQVPVPPEKDGQSAFYLNSGTWRTTLPYGEKVFGRLRAYTLVFVFNQEESRAGNADGRRFETWTGHLSSEFLGPYDQEVALPPDAPDPAVPARQLVFKRLEIRNVEREWNGAEIRARFGVDDQARETEWVKVKRNSELAVDVSPVPLDPALDGQVWFHGIEVDAGESGIDPHDLLPWAFALLPRETSVPPNPHAQFVPGQYALRIAGLNDTDFVLHYEII
jgi:UDP-2,3-diacylglucosamine pyrophosphatase LpxH